MHRPSTSITYEPSLTSTSSHDDRELSDAIEAFDNLKKEQPKSKSKAKAVRLLEKLGRSTNSYCMRRLLYLIPIC